MKMILAIAAGGATGALARHFAAHWMAAYAGVGFPWAIFAINVLGSCIMGVLIEGSALSWSFSAETRAFLTVGILGGFTTFSTFALDSLLLFNRGEWITAALYICLSVFLSIAALALGMQATRYFLIG